MDERARRIGANEALFREVNERVKDVNAGFGDLVDPEFVCECGDRECFERIAVPVGEYERVRADARTFLVKEGHEKPDYEAVVGRGSGYVVVRKHLGEAATVALETDPRA